MHIQSHIYTPTMLVDLFVPLGPGSSQQGEIWCLIFASAAVRVLPGDNTRGVHCASSYEERQMPVIELAETENSANQ